MAKRTSKYHHSKAMVGVATPTVVASAFNSGSRTAKNVACWTPPLQSADRDMLPEKALTAGRAQDLSRNNGYAKGAIQSKKDRVVGSYFKLQLRPLYDLIPGLDIVTATKWASTVEKAFHLYADDPDCWIDARRQSTFTQLLRESAGLDMIHGECFLSREFRPSETGYGTCFLSIEPERVCNPSEFSMDIDGLRQGVYLDGYGAATDYSIRTRHQRDIGMQSVATWRKVPKYNAYGRLNIIHTFERDRPNQTRGFSPFASIIGPLKMLDILKGTALESAIASTIYTMYVKSDLNSSVLEAMQTDSGAADVDGGLMAAYMNATANHNKGLNLSMDGVRLPHLAPGESIEMVGSNNQAGAFQPMEQTNLREVARGYDLTYEELTGDYTNTTYSSARMSQQVSWEHIKAKREGTVIKTANQMMRAWLDEAVAIGKITMPKGVDYWTHRAALTNCDWIGAGRIIVDEVKHAAALEKLIALGVSTLQDACAEQGKDWEAVMQQQRIEQDKRDELGIRPSADSTFVYQEAPTQ